jgi:hypothetical protein
VKEKHGAGACRVLARGQIVFFVWVSLSEQKWVILGERRSRCVPARKPALFAASKPAKLLLF